MNGQTYRRNHKDLRPIPEQITPLPADNIPFQPTSDVTTDDTQKLIQVR